LRELEARTHVAIRRTQKSLPGKLMFPPIEIDLEERRVLCNDVDLSLTHREFDILCFLATSKKDVITYEEIGKKIWGVYQEPDRQSVMVNISRLRKKLEINPVTARMIETVWSEGYRFVSGGG
jgi:DNA-binding response OmpR family regulator